MAGTSPLDASEGGQSRTFVRRFQVPPEAIWPILSDTARFNEAAKLPKHTIEEIPQDDGSVQYIGRAKIGPFSIVWDDRPVNWVANRWFRHCRELIDPADYLTRPYFDQWMQTYAAMLIDSGVFSVAEISAAARAPASERTRSGLGSDPAALDKGRGFDRDVTEAPNFAVGDPVQTKVLGSIGHTRLPGYLRGRAGVIDHCYGAHVFADASAKGEERAEALYSVKFSAENLWPEAKGRREWVHGDLWESYLEPG